MARLDADENFPLPAVEALRRLGHDVLTAAEAGQGIADAVVLAFAHAQGRAVLTHHRKHFRQLNAGHAHSGLVLCTEDADFVALGARIDAALAGAGAPPGQQFWESRENDSEIAERDFSAWYKLAKGADWANFGALKQTFGTADQVGNCVVFDVGHNWCRLIARVRYAAGIIYVLRPMDHHEYDRKRGVDECGCYKPPPKESAAAKKAPAKASRPRTRRKGG